MFYFVRIMAIKNKAVRAVGMFCYQRLPRISEESHGNVGRMVAFRDAKNGGQIMPVKKPLFHS